MNNVEFTAYRNLETEVNRLRLLLAESRSLNGQLSQTLAFSRAYLASQSKLSPAFDAVVSKLLLAVSEENE